MSARLSGNTINERFASRIEATPDRPAYWIRAGSEWQETSWRGFGKLAHTFAAGLQARGHQRTEAVAILGETRAEWAICDLGTLAIGGTVVGVYPTLTAEQSEYVIEHSDASTLIVQDQAQLDKCLSAPSGLPKVSRIIVWDAPESARDPRVVSYAEVLAEGETALARDPNLIARASSEIKPEDPALIIYTSGTTGPPKGAVLSHENVAFMMAIIAEILPASENDTGFAFLPMAHIAEHVVGMFGRIQIGYGAYYARSIETVLEDVAASRPTLFGSVPRVFEKAYARIQGTISESKGVKKALAQWAFGMARKASRARQAGGRLSPLDRALFAVADRLVLAKIRHVFGGRVRFFVSGAAPIAFEILEFFDGCGLVTYEVYGMTESTALITANREGAIKLGTVGRVLPGVEIQIADDGEILARGKNVFVGYHKNPEATREAIDAGGWLHTGDIGEVDADGYLRITGRKKDLIITAGGKNIAPANIEELLKQDPLIAQVLVHGDRRKYLSALITLDPEAAAGFAQSNGLPNDPQALVTSRQVQDHVGRHVAACNEQLARFETIKKWAVLAEDFTVENGMLTPTMKVRRTQVEERHRDLLNDLYADDAG